LIKENNTQVKVQPKIMIVLGVVLDSGLNLHVGIPLQWTLHWCPSTEAVLSRNNHYHFKTRRCL